MLAGLSNEDAARYAFLLATPIIGAAALLKLPDLFGSQGDGVRGPALVGALCAALTAYLSVRFLMRFFETQRLTPFAIYCTPPAPPPPSTSRSLRTRATNASRSTSGSSADG